MKSSIIENRTLPIFIRLFHTILLCHATLCDILTFRNYFKSFFVFNFLIFKINQSYLSKNELHYLKLTSYIYYIF